VIFTGSGTEANNAAIKGLFWAAPEKNLIVVSAIEHHAVLDPAHWLVEHEGAELIEIPVTADGVDDTKPNYLNGVVQIQTTLKPKELLEQIHRIETEHGRIRLERWGSRTLDIDIITYGDVLKVGKELTIPHPRAFERAFVLVPWAMLEPDAVLPGHGPVKELAEPMKSEVWLAK
jgi:2-amino-4-hydroxy-6-hydroxymethyldihydropteridine diphosphokinase